MVKNMCVLCGGNNLPHPMDEYHLYLQELKFANDHLQQAKSLSKRLPSIQIQLQQTITSMKNLRKESKKI